MWNDFLSENIVFFFHQPMIFGQFTVGNLIHIYIYIHTAEAIFSLAFHSPLIKVHGDIAWPKEMNAYIQKERERESESKVEIDVVARQTYICFRENKEYDCTVALKQWKKKEKKKERKKKRGRKKMCCAIVKVLPVTVYNIKSAAKAIISMTLDFFFFFSLMRRWVYTTGMMVFFFSSF